VLRLPARAGVAEPTMTRFAPIVAVAALAVAPVHAAPPAPEAVRADAREIFATAVGIETSIGKGQVPKLAEYLADRFRKGGFPAADVHVLPLGETASLVVRYRGSGRGGRPLAFLAHMDVVTAKRADWQRDPFMLIEANGYFFGRGTSDVKQEVALLTETFLRLKAEGFVPSRDLIIAFSGDEETSQATAEDLVTNHRDLVDAEFALNGDGGGGVLAEDTGRPSLFYVQGAEKYSVTFSVTVRNPGGHSSQPRADNAIYELADALKAVQGFAFPVMWNDWTLGDLKAASAVAPAALGAAMTRFVADPHDADAAAEIARHPQYVGKLRTTCVATMLQGGHADNALPQSATATVNCRVFPGTPVDEVEQTLQRLAGPKVEVKRNYEPTVSDASPLRDDVMRVVARAVAAANPGARIVPTQAAYATDGLVYRNAGIPTYGVGSSFTKESEEFAHGLNERIPVASFYSGLTHWYVIIKALAGKG
jgi:acetylornithine deacetylase/succinyl-diaminopimelate desuccinylase-like protein